MKHTDIKKIIKSKEEFIGQNVNYLRLGSYFQKL